MNACILQTLFFKRDFKLLKVLKKRSWNWITKEVRLLVEEKKQTSRILCVQDKAKITTGPSTSTHWRSTDAQNTVSEAHDFAFRALASLSLSQRVLARQSLSVCVCVLESYGIMSSFMIPAMKQPEFQIVSKKAKISRGHKLEHRWKHSKGYDFAFRVLARISLSLSLSEVFVSLSLLGSYGIFMQPAMLEVKTRIKNNSSSSSSLRGRQLTSQRNKLTPSLRSTNNWGFLHHFLLQKHREKEKKRKEEDKTHISSTRKQKLN